MTTIPQPDAQVYSLRVSTSKHDELFETNRPRLLYSYEPESRWWNGLQCDAVIKRGARQQKAKAAGYHTKKSLMACAGLPFLQGGQQSTQQSQQCPFEGEQSLGRKGVM